MKRVQLLSHRTLQTHSNVEISLGTCVRVLKHPTEGKHKRVPWQSSGWDLALSLLWAWIESLVWVRSCKQSSQKKEGKQKIVEEGVS